jgi:hypothetical protein
MRPLTQVGAEAVEGVGALGKELLPRGARLDLRVHQDEARERRVHEHHVAHLDYVVRIAWGRQRDDISVGGYSMDF